jgi:uncharacterized protein
MKKITIILIKLYQKIISPAYSWIFKNYFHGCRFYPSCSEYTIQAINKYGALKGLFLGFKRILKCSPLSEGGVDLI